MGDIADWPIVNDIYKSYFTDPSKYPARTAFQAGKLPVGARIEIEAVAICGEVKDNPTLSQLWKKSICAKRADCEFCSHATLNFESDQLV